MTTQWQAKSQAAQSEFIFVDTKLKRDAFKEVVKVNAMRKLHNRRQRHQSSHLYPTKGGELQLWIQSTAQSKSTPEREYFEIRQHVVNHPVTTCNEADQRASMCTPAGSVVTTETFSCVSSCSPYNRLGAGRCDPFRQYPYQSHYIDRLVDYYVSSRGCLLSIELLSLYRADPASFSSFLAVVSTQFSATGSLHPDIFPDEAESQALRLLNGRLENSSLTLHEGTFLAIALIANLEECRGNRATADLHWNGLKKAIQVKGGLQKMILHKEVYAAVFWIELVANASRDCCLGQLSPERYSGQARSDQIDIIPTKEDFTQEYDRFFRRIILHVSDSQSTFSSPSNMPECIISCIRQERDEYQQRLRKTKMACLIYLAAVRLDCLPDNPEVFDHFVLQVQHNPYLQDGQRILCGEELLHFLYKGVGLSDSQNCQFSCLLSRLMCVTRALSEDQWDASFGILSYFLGIPYDTCPLHELVNNWQ